MKSKTQKSDALPAPFQSGQVWQLGDSHVRIGLVGRTLVHYKLYKGLAKRPPILLSGKPALEEFLRAHSAVLLPDGAKSAKSQPRFV